MYERKRQRIIQNIAQNNANYILEMQKLIMTPLFKISKSISVKSVRAYLDKLA